MSLSSQPVQVYAVALRLFICAELYTNVLIHVIAGLI